MSGGDTWFNLKEIYILDFGKLSMWNYSPPVGHVWFILSCSHDFEILSTISICNNEKLALYRLAVVQFELTFKCST